MRLFTGAQRTKPAIPKGALRTFAKWYQLSYLSHYHLFVGIRPFAFTLTVDRYRKKLKLRLSYLYLCLREGCQLFSLKAF